MSQIGIADSLRVAFSLSPTNRSTQMPQYARAALGGHVVCTQPRRVAAMTLAARVASECSTGLWIGF